MKDNQFDDLVKNKLQNHESSVPADMWERITGNKKERKGAFALRTFLLIAALAVFGFAGNYFFLQISNKNNKDVAFNKNDLSSKIIKKDINKQSSNKKVSPDGLRIKKMDSSGKIVNLSQRKKQIRNYSFLVGEREGIQTIYNLRPFFKSVDISGERSVVTNHTKTSEYQNNNIDSLIKRLTKESVSSKSDTSENSETKEDEAYNDKFSLEMYISPDMPVNWIHSSNESYEQVLKKTNTTRFSYTFGTRMKYEITKRLSAKIGLQYAQINEKIVYVSSGPAHNFTSSNRYRNIGVPLLISYKTTRTSDLDLSINTGIIVNIASRYKGAIPSVSGEPIDLNNNSVYDRNTSANLYLGVDISKKINKRTDIFAEPWFSYGLKNMVNPFYLFQQKIHTPGLTLGLRYRLFKNEAK